MDKGTSESSLLGAGSPLPSIPLHYIVLYRIIKSNIQISGYIDIEIYGYPCLSTYV